MTDPTSKTVRGWQVDILGALAGLSSLSAVAAELSYLNKRLFGKDSTGAAIASADLPALIDLMRFQDFAPGTSTGPLTYSLGAWLKLRLGSLSDGTSATELLQLLTDYTGNTAANLVYGEADASAAELLNRVVIAIGAIEEAPSGFSVKELLAQIEDNTLRSAECCEDVPTGPTYPDPAGLACPDYEELVLIGEWYDAGGGTHFVEWTAQGNPTIYAFPIFDEPCFGTTINGRELCFVLVAANEETDPSWGISGTINPINVVPGGFAARPSINHDGSSPQVLGTFWSVDAPEVETIAYQWSATGTGTDLQYPIRVYVYAGAAG